MLEGIDRIEGRIQEIEQRIQAPPPDAELFAAMMANKTAGPKKPAKDAAAMKLNAMNAGPIGTKPPANPTGVTAQAQNNSVSCGQTSVAMCINALTGQNLKDYDIDNKYGFQLMDALNGECKSVGVNWSDAGNISADKWPLIEQKVMQEGTPVIVALNGPEFSVSGRGHIVTIVKVEGDKVTFADPATGTTRTTTKQAMNSAPSHPDGNFVFYANRGNGLGTPPASPPIGFNPQD